MAKEISPSLTNIFKTSLDTGQLPEEWKHANISALFKKGDKRSPGNYRPVSLTCVICKIMEKLIREQIVNHMKGNKLFSNKQYGFIEGRSTGLQLIKVIDLWTEMLENDNEIDIIYMDFKKAFDTVPHHRLLKKIQSYGIAGNIYQWIKSFLTHRKQRVSIKGTFSTWEETTSGIPQGSVLGPLLFVIYINDMPEQINSKIFMFADDTKIFTEISTRSDQDMLQEDIKKLDKWSNTWLLEFHPEKCKQMTVTKKNEENNREYHMRGQSNQIHKIERTHLEKDLGVNIDSQLEL